MYNMIDEFQNMQETHSQNVNVNDQNHINKIKDKVWSGCEKNIFDKTQRGMIKTNGVEGAIYQT